MLNENNTETSLSRFYMTPEQLELKQRRDRDDYYSSLRSYERLIAQQAEEIARLAEEKAHLEQQIARL